MRCSARALASAALLALPAALPAEEPPPPAVTARLEERFDWPEEAAGRLSMTAGDLLVLSRVASGPSPSAPVVGASLPWVRTGPLVLRGALRQAADPLAFYSWSGVFQERTDLVLDGALESHRQGIVLMPLPGWGGLFLCERAGLRQQGGIVRAPLGGGASLEGLLLSSRPGPAQEVEEWYPDRSSHVGADVTHAGGRLALDSALLDLSFTGGVSSARWAQPGSFASMWVRGHAPDLEGALLVSAASAAYRDPEGETCPDASLTSATVRLGQERNGGAFEAGWAFVTGRPGFAPDDEVPVRTLLRLRFWRDFASEIDRPVVLLAHADKQVARDAEGGSAESWSCGAALSVGRGPVSVRTGAGFSATEGGSVDAGVSATPGSQLRLGLEVRTYGLSSASPSVSVFADVALKASARTRSTLKVGFERCPLITGRLPSPSRFFVLSLATSVVLTPSPPPG